MPFFTKPTSYRLNLESASGNVFAMTDASLSSDFVDALKSNLSKHSSHPDFGHLVLLVFEAVLEVVCVSLPGYILARQGLFDAEAQKFVANLNVNLFTPCLVFTKLASQLTADKLAELAVIPIIFLVQTCVSYFCARVVSRLFGFHKRATNFVIAMGVFGNSNSLPISLVLSLSKTLKGLHWDRIPGDNDNEVAARGILYLLIFQQLGQMLRWSWGYNVLLKPADAYAQEDGGHSPILEGGEYYDEPEESRSLLSDWSVDEELDSSNASVKKASKPSSHSDYESGNVSADPDSQDESSPSSSVAALNAITTTPLAGNGAMTTMGKTAISRRSGNVNERPPLGYGTLSERLSSLSNNNAREEPDSSNMHRKLMSYFGKFWHQVHTTTSKYVQIIYDSLPKPLRLILRTLYRVVARFIIGLWSFMNPPLWAIIAALVVASVPRLQHLFFDKGTFVNNSVTRAISQNGGVAVPLILVVLGANLARNTLPEPDMHSFDDPKEERNLLIASIVSRMVLPTAIMAPLLALTAKYVPVSILDDPIFVIVCFLLTGAPSALQLAQICQINNVYMGAMSRLLFQSYVIWILPSTLILVMMALEVVEWAVV